MYNMLKAGLEDISISRVKEKLSWGVAVPGDDTQVMYVWFDALTNYITALGYGSDDETLLKQFWPGVNVLGKEINRFHSLLWPAMLMAAGLEPPKQIAVHGWITVDGQKMSKTLGNVINPIELIEEFPLEAVRYFLMREIPFDNDGDFSRTKFLERYQGDLANGIGNLTNRILTMVEKYCDSVVPPVGEVNHELIDFLSTKVWPAYNEAMGRWRFDHALEQTMRFVTHCDQLISDREPWKLAKQGEAAQVNDLLYHLVESLRHIAVMLWPILPDTAENILRQLGLEVAKEFAKPLAELHQWVELTVGNKIEKGAVLFPRLENSSETK
jgi:methionyl-tRNA synthetase